MVSDIFDRLSGGRLVEEVAMNELLMDPATVDCLDSLTSYTLTVSHTHTHTHHPPQSLYIVLDSTGSSDSAERQQCPNRDRLMLYIHTCQSISECCNNNYSAANEHTNNANIKRQQK